MKLACIVMASGASVRFGANKLLTPLEGRPLFHWALDAIPDGVFAQVVVVTGYDPVAREAERRGFLTVNNDCPADGVSRTIRLGLRAAEECDGALFMTADQPLLSAQTLRCLAAAFCTAPDRILAAAHEGRRGNPCLFPREFFPELAALMGDTGGAAVIRAHPDRLSLVEIPAWELWDCDTPETLAVCREKVLKNS